MEGGPLLMAALGVSRKELMSWNQRKAIEEECQLQKLSGEAVVVRGLENSRYVDVHKQAPKLSSKIKDWL